METIDGPPPATAGEMGLLEHLGELRNRLVICFIAVTITSIVAYSFTTELFFLLSRPFFDSFPQNLLIGTGPAEAFVLKIKVSVLTGIVLAAPIVFYQLWLFIAPGLYDHEKKLVIPFVAVASGLFAIGIWFCYVAVIPIAFSFFKEQYDSIGVTPTIRLSEHLSMMATALLSFGAIFELPVVAFFLGRVGIITDDTLISGFRYAVVIIFIISAVLTPPDVISQFLMAVPLLVLYGISILVVRFTGRPRDLTEETELPSTGPRNETND